MRARSALICGIVAISLLNPTLLHPAFANPAFADSADALPELGAPEANTAVLQPNINAQGADLSYRDNINGKLISISPQYNRQNGVAIGGSLASPLGKNMAAGILLMAGDHRNEWLLNAGLIG